jgi:hypothetical protein
MICSFISQDDASFRAVCMLLAQHPQYANVPLRRTLDILRAVQSRQVFAAVEGNELLGVVIWKETGAEAARQAIARRQLPAPSACQDRGDVLVATAFLARSIEVGRTLWTTFLKTHQGRVVLYERHRLEAQSRPVFKWMDKSGRSMGPDV